jgi:hypothetical protein
MNPIKKWSIRHAEFISASVTSIKTIDPELNSG